MNKALILAILLLSVNCQLKGYNVDIDSTSTSGISAGGYMAVQFHIAYSDIMVGTGVVAGGPFMCAEGQLTNALLGCMSMPASINLSSIQTHVAKEQNQGHIDSIENMPRQNVYLFSGTKDTVVKQGVMEHLETQYKSFGVKNIQTEFTMAAQHAWITNNYGNACAFKGEPYINNCDYNQAQQILSTIYGDLKPQEPQVSKNLIEFNQSYYKSTGDSLNDKAYVYVPTACQNGEECKIHVAFHGCEQTLADIGTKFVVNSGLNEVAEANNIIVLYPQAKRSQFSPSNPNGCFDWWGYTDSQLAFGSVKYATKLGTQMKSIFHMINNLAGKKSPSQLENIE